jgi:hypothetical protein
MGMEVLFLGMKQQACESDQLPPDSADTDITMELYFYLSVQEKISPD